MKALRKLHIPVHMGFAHLEGLLVELQTVAKFLEKFPDLDMAEIRYPCLLSSGWRFHRLFVVQHRGFSGFPIVDSKASASRARSLRLWLSESMGIILDILFFDALSIIGRVYYARAIYSIGKLLINLQKRRGECLYAGKATKHFLKCWRNGIVIKVSSVHQTIPKPKWIGYSVGKGGVQDLTRC